MRARCSHVITSFHQPQVRTGSHAGSEFQEKKKKRVLQSLHKSPEATYPSLSSIWTFPQAQVLDLQHQMQGLLVGYDLDLDSQPKGKHKH